MIIVLVASRLIGGAPAEAHGSGPPYVKINNDYALTSPILNLAAPTAFEVGMDVASVSGYLVGQTIVFEIDEQFFPNPYAQAQNPFGLPVVNAPGVPEPIFRWDFKDGSGSIEGKNVSYAFIKPGTYIVELAAKFIGKTNDFAVVDTIQMDVFPAGEYVIPKPKITVDGKRIEDPQRDTAPIKPVKPVAFDAIVEGEIASFHWDFGDGEGTEGKTTTHRYKRDEYFPVVVLRVTDAYGIKVDTYALLDMPFEKPNFFLRIWYAITDFLSGL